MLARQLPIGKMTVYLTVAPNQCNHTNGFNDDSCCVDCGWQCRQHQWIDGHCNCCGLECHHEEFEDGYCMECGAYVADIFDTDRAYDNYKDSL